MRQPNLRHDNEPVEFQADERGCLYDPKLRELVAQQGRRINPASEALAAVRILSKKMHAAMEGWADHYGLSEGRFFILIRLNHVKSGRLTMSDLAEMLEVTPRTVTGLIDNLERDGLVRRVNDPNDRRAVYAELTEEGRARLQKLWREAAVGQAALTRGISEEELAQLRHLCLRLIKAMSEQEGKIHARN